MTFASQESLNKHNRFSGFNSDLTKIKTEVLDSEQEYQSFAKTSAPIPTSNKVTVDKLNHTNVKTEVKSELPDSADVEDVSNKNVNQHNEGNRTNIETNIFLVNTWTIQTRKKRGRTPKAFRNIQQTTKNINIAPKPHSPSSSNVKITSLPKRSQNFANILPKATENDKDRNVKIINASSTQHSINSQRVTTSGKHSQNAPCFSVTNISTACSTSSVTTVSTSGILSGTGGLSTSTSLTASTLPYSPLVFMTPVVQNTQQNPFVLGSSAPILIPMQNVNTLSTSGLVSTPHPLNFPRPLTNLQNLNIAQHQNLTVCGQQDMIKVRGSEMPVMGSVIASPISPSQNMSGKVPMLLGNQFVMVNQPSHFQAENSVKNIPGAITLPPLIQSPTAMPVSLSVAAGTLNIGQLNVGVSTVTSHQQAVLTTTGGRITQHQPKVESSTSTQKKIKNKKGIKPPHSSVLAVGSASQLHSQLATVGLSDIDKGKSDDLTEESNMTPIILETFSLKNRDHSFDESCKNLDSEEGISFNAKCQEIQNLQTQVSDPKLITPDTCVVPSAPVMSTTAANLIITTKRPMLDASAANIQNILSPPAVTPVMQQSPVLLSQFQQNQNVLQSPISVLNNPILTNGLFFPSNITTPGTNITALCSAEQNVMIQNMTSGQFPSTFRCNNSLQSFLNIEPLVKNPTTSSATTVSVNSNKSSRSQDTSLLHPKDEPHDKRRLKINSTVSKKEMKRKILPSGEEEKDLFLKVFVSDTSSSDSHKVPKTVRAILQNKKALKDLQKSKAMLKHVLPNTKGTKDKMLGACNKNSIKIKMGKRRNLKVVKNVKTSCDDLSSYSSNPEADTVVTKQMIQCKKITTHYKSPKIQPASNVVQESNIHHMSSQLTGDVNTELKHSILQIDTNSKNDILVNSDSPESKSDICKISEIKSISNSPSELAKIVNSNHLFVGPLTQEQMITIMKNPSELEKYVSVPTGHIISSKALVVPAGGSSTVCTVLSLPQSPVVASKASAIPFLPVQCKNVEKSIPIQPKTLPPLKPIRPRTLAQLIPIQPKTEQSVLIQPQTATPPSQISLPADVANTVDTSFQKMYTSFNEPVISANDPKFSSNKQVEICSKSLKETEKLTEKVKLETEEYFNECQEPFTSLSVRIRKKKFLSEKRRNELKRLRMEENQNNMKLSFVGDMKLLKDALRKSTVSIKPLNIDVHSAGKATLTYDSPVMNTHRLVKNEFLDESDDEYRPTSKIWKWHNYEPRRSSKIECTGKKENKTGENREKQWIPVEVVGDLAIAGKIFDSILNSGETFVNEGKRRSSRISSKPKLDYAALEKLSFKELDEEIGESDSDFELGKDSFEIITEFDDEADVEDRSVLDKTIKCRQSASRSPDKTATHSLKHGTSTAPLSPQFQKARSPSPPVLSPQRSATRTSLNSSSETMDVETAEASPPVLTSQDAKEIHSLPQESNLNDYYYSSESESDVLDLKAESLNQSDKKKIMWKRHNEVTMFLIKHAGKFHSNDDDGEHSCNICNKYKTNGIFSLSKHLKKHLAGELKCAKCSYEAPHTSYLSDHDKNFHMA